MQTFFEKKNVPMGSSSHFLQGSEIVQPVQRGSVFGIITGNQAVDHIGRVSDGVGSFRSNILKFLQFFSFH